MNNINKIGKLVSEDINDQFVLLREAFIEPGIDHHLEQGVTVDSYAELIENINSQILPRLSSAAHNIANFLDANETVGNTQRVFGRLRIIATELQRLVQAANQWSTRFTNNNESHNTIIGVLDSHIEFTRVLRRRVIAIANDLQEVGRLQAIQMLNGVVEAIDEYATDIGRVREFFRRGHTDPGSNIRQVAINAIAEYGVNQIDGQPLPDDLDSLDDTELEDFLLSIPENLWLFHLRPADGVEFAERHQEHGINESPNKIMHIIRYGPESYNNCGEQLRLLIRYWNVSANDLTQLLDQVGFGNINQEDQYIYFIHNDGYEYGLT